MSENLSSNENLIAKKNQYQSSILELYKLVSKSEIFLVIVALILAILLSTLPILLVLELGEIMKTIQHHRGDRDKFYEEQQKSSIIMLCLGALSIICSIFAVACFIKLANTLSMRYREKYFSVVINKPIKWFDKHNPAELGSVINKDCELIERAIGEKFLIGVYSILLFFLSWITAFTINVELSIIAMLIMPLQLIAAAILQQSNQAEIQIYQEKYASSSATTEENLEGVKTIAACNAQHEKSENFQKEFDSLRRPRTIYSTLFSFGAGLMYCILFSFTGVLFYIGAYFMAVEPDIFGYSTSVDPVDSILVFFLTALTTIYIGSSLPAIIAFESGRQSAAKINSLISKNKKYDGDLTVESIKGSIKFKQVYFKYPSSPNLHVLQGVSFKVDPGKSLALVGETGCGKSTIIQLISGFYYAESGSVMIDKIDIKDYDLKSLRNFISLVSQEPIVFNYSIKENIRMGNPNATDEEVEKAAIEAEGLEFILGLPEKFNTLVGIKGCQISGGQKQRIAIARAILKQPKILLLDEATSALDMKTERKIQATLNKVIEGKTTIIAAQRLSTIKNADRIAVIEQGQIIESGSFDELILLNGAFVKLIIGEKDVETGKTTEITNESNSSNSKSKELSTKLESITKTKVISRLTYILCKYWSWSLLASLGSIVAGSTFPLFGYFFAENINSLLTESDDSAEDECKKNMVNLCILGISMLFSLIIAYSSITKISLLYSNELRYNVMSSLLCHDQEFFDTPGNTPASLSCRLTSNCDKVSKIGGLILILQIISIVSVVIGIMISMLYNIFMSLLAIMFIPGILYTFIMHENIEKNGLAPKNLVVTAEIVSDSLTNIRTVHSLNQQEAFKQQYIKANLLENENSRTAMLINGLFFGIRLSFMYTFRAALGWFGAYLAKEHEISMEEYLIVFFDLSFATWSLNFVGFFASDLEEGFKCADEIYEITDNAPEIDVKSEGGVVSSIEGKVEFKQVSFSYRSRDTQVLKQVSFKVEAGQRLGITGTTGSGKSTIAQLLLRFYNPNSGEILIDGLKIEKYNVKYLRDCVAWVGQEPILFKGSILDNIKLGNQELTLSQVMEAVQEAQASDIIEKYGLNSDVGLRGNRLSGGQKQRIAIARALIRSPKILILDESTSALDSITERLFQERMKEKQCTIIAISHRLQTIQDFDCIIVLEKGAVVEKGTHEELLEIENGVYYSLIKTQ